MTGVAPLRPPPRAPRVRSRRFVAIAVALVATVTATRTRITEPGGLGPEHFSVLQLAQVPATVVDIASDVDLPLGVVRILLADLRELGLVTIQAPVPVKAHQIDRETLREVLHGLRGL